MIKLAIREEQIKELKNKIKTHKEKPGPLMPSLHDAQKLIGCIPYEIQKMISKELNIPVAKINGVVTFYAQFSLEPKGENIIGVCLGTACYVKGAQAILDKIGSELKIKSNETTEDGKFTLEATRCIGACGLAPVMTVNEEVYGNLNVSKSVDALNKHKEGAIND
ncbi:NAD(P)H-dependent oxidoreductase subunit E [Mycoplasmatota bacterium zrk1]